MKISIYWRNYYILTFHQNSATTVYFNVFDKDLTEINWLNCRYKWFNFQ